jgi:predicted ABC-type ATPase
MTHSDDAQGGEGPERGPRVIVLAGSNGAGKSTSARTVLAERLGLTTFDNADVIAQGLAGFDPASAALEASRIMLERLRALAERRADFAFETTLAARSYAPWLTELRAGGYTVDLVYFWLASAGLAVARVAERVRTGGHDVPEATVQQRYMRSVRNFFTLYRPAVDRWQFFDNSGSGAPQLNSTRGQVRTSGRVQRESPGPDQGASPMSEPARASLAERMADPRWAEAAVRRAVREAVLTHAKLGHPVATWRDGRVVWLQPAEVLAALAAEAPVPPLGE